MTNSDLFDAALLLAARESGQEEVNKYMSMPLIEHEFSLLHKRKIKSLFRSEKYSDVLSEINTIARRTAAAVLIVCTVLFGTFISIKAVREDIWRAVTSFFEEYFSFGTDNSEVQESITEYKAPSWIPEGYTEIDNQRSKQNFDIVYISDSGDLLIYSQYMYNYSAVQYDNEDVEITDVLINGFSGIAENVK